MSLKKLSRFQKFDAQNFFKSKEMLFTKIEEWQEGDAENRQTVGTKVTGVILIDKTDYGNDQVGINKGESIVFKVSQPVTEFAGWKPFVTRFQCHSFTKVTLYGDFRNQLSVKVPSLSPVVKKVNK